MPSHIAHALFAEAVLEQTPMADLLKVCPEIITFAAQGPDIFYHNRRTKPTSTFLGLQIHRGKYGTFIKNMTDEALILNDETRTEAMAFIGGMITHAFLDRVTHPFINYFSGWREPGKPETEKYRRTHAFFERIIDVFLLKRERGCSTNDYDFYRRVDLGERLPEHFHRLISHSYNITYQDEPLSERTRQRIHNAYTDTMSFYRWTNFTSPEYFQAALEREKKGQIRTHWLALIHPPFLPDSIDFMNQSRRQWINPCSGEDLHNESFWDLYDKAIHDTVPVLSVLHDVFGGMADTEKIAELVGDHSLSDEDHDPCNRTHSAPLPLPELLEDIHRKIAQSCV